MKSPKNIRILAGALLGVVVLAGAGWFAARQIKSPAQIAADTAAPKPSLITAAVTRQVLSSQEITRGTVRYGLPTPVSLPTSLLKSGGSAAPTPIVGQVPKTGAKLREGKVAMTVSGRPMIVLRGDAPMNRDLSPGETGDDVRQLESALVRLGMNPGPVDGRYDGATAAAVAAMYRKVGFSPFGVTDAQFDKFNTVAQAESAATDKVLQARLALRVAERGTTPAEINQARLDAAAVQESITAARAAISSASSRIADAQDAELIAKRGQLDGDAGARRDVAAASIDVTAKQNALHDAIELQAEAQRAVNALAPDATPAEVETARAALRAAAAKVPGAQADLVASQSAYRAAENVVAASSTKAGDDGRKAQRDLLLAQSDLRHGQQTLSTLHRKRNLALDRVRILRRANPTGIERAGVVAAVAEQHRSQTEVSRIALGMGVQVPADEILFVTSTPAYVESVAAKRGTPASGDLMTVTNTSLAIDGQLTVDVARRVKVGQPVQIQEPDLGINLTGVVSQVASQNGTNTADAGKRYIEIRPSKARASLVGTSAVLKIAVESTNGAVLAVPLNAVSTAANGDQRVTLVLPGGRTRPVKVNVGLVANGLLEIRPVTPGALKVGDNVVAGTTGSSAALKSVASKSLPATPGTTASPAHTTSTPAGGSGTTTGATHGP